MHIFKKIPPFIGLITSLILYIRCLEGSGYYSSEDLQYAFQHGINYGASLGMLFVMSITFLFERNTKNIRKGIRKGHVEDID